MNIGEKKEFIGYVDKYNVVLAIDELLRTETEDCEQYKITIEKLGAEMI